VALAGGAVGGYALAHQGSGPTTVDDGSGTLTVTVPPGWDGAVAGDGWQPPGQEAHYPALSVGTSTGWTTSDKGEGVFVGLLPGTDLPPQLPQHPECDGAEDPVPGTSQGDESVTVVYTGCPGGITVERVVQLTANRLLWVQVRSDDTATANRVLDDVMTHGFS
jgi:hypothetical protein